MANTLQDIARTLEDNIRAGIKGAGHYETGHLYDSIQVTFDSTSSKFTVKAAKYIEYLEDGKFYKKLLETETQKITPLLASFYKQQTIDEIAKDK